MPNCLCQKYFSILNYMWIRLVTEFAVYLVQAMMEIVLLKTSLIWCQCSVMKHRKLWKQSMLFEYLVSICFWLECWKLRFMAPQSKMLRYAWGYQFHASRNNDLQYSSVIYGQFIQFIHCITAYYTTDTPWKILWFVWSKHFSTCCRTKFDKPYFNYTLLIILAKLHKFFWKKQYHNYF